MYSRWKRSTFACFKINPLMKSIVLTAVLGILFATATSAQDSVDQWSDAPQPIASEETIDASLFMDEEERIFYVDLEKVPFVCSQAALINNRGDEVIVKSLDDERVDTIVELDYNSLPQGSYVLELRSYGAKVAKAVQL